MCEYPISIGMLTNKALEYRHPQDFYIHQQGPIANVLQVVSDTPGHFVEGFGFAPETIDLCETGDARLHLVTQHITLDLTAIKLIM